MRSTLGTVKLAVLYGLLALSGSAIGATDESVPSDRRIDFKAAKLATEKGKVSLALEMLEELDAAADSQVERDLYRAVAARLRQDVDAFEQLVERAYSGWDDEAGTVVPDWVESELLHLVSEVRLAQRVRAAGAKLDAVLKRHYEALGGLDHVASLRSYVAVGKMSVGDRQIPFRLLRMAPAFYRLDIATPGGVVVEAADSQAAWTSNPSVDEGKPVYVDGAHGDNLRRGAHFLGPLLRYRATGETLLYTGMEPIDGRDHHVIEVSTDGGAESRIFLDTESFLATRRVHYNAKGEATATVTTEYGEQSGHLLPARQVFDGRSGRLVFDYREYFLDRQMSTELFDAGSVAFGAADEGGGFSPPSPSVSEAQNSGS